MDYEHLNSSCLDAHTICKNPSCTEAVKVDPRSGRYFITMGHCGFNSTQNNGPGYCDEKNARKSMQRYIR